MTWHTDGATLRGYQAGTLAPARSASVEAHLAACATCRAELAGAADGARLDRNWAAIADRLDERSLTHVERALIRLGIAEDHARLVVMTPAARSASLLGLVVLLALVSAVSALDGGSRDGTFYAFVVLAPLLPVAGVGAAFGSVGDPASELTASTSRPAFQLLLVRSLAVVAVTTVVTTVAALPFSGDWQAAAWLLPALGLTAASLALSTWVVAHAVAVGLATAWVVAAAASWRANRFDPDVLARFVALRPGGQALFAVVAVAGMAVVLVRRDAFDLRRPV